MSGDLNYWHRSCPAGPITWLNGPLLGLLLVLSGCSGDEKTQETTATIRPVKAEVVGEKMLQNRASRLFPGTAKSANEADLSFLVAGKILTFPVEKGQAVKKDQVLATLDARDYEIALRDAEARLSKAKASYLNAEQEYQRALQIQRDDPGAISQALIDLNETKFKQTRANTESLQAKVDADLSRLQYTRLLAPFDGMIVDRFVDNFETVQAKQRILRITNPDRIEFVINIPEDLIKNRGRVKNIMVRFDAYPQQLIPAQIKEWSPEASAITRTYEVTLTLQPPEGILILPGMSGHTSSELEPVDGNKIFIIPSTALTAPIDGGEGFYVWLFIKEDTQEEADRTLGHVARQEIVTGDLSNNGIQVLSGLSAGDILITAGAQLLTEGQRVYLPKLKQPAQ